MVCWPFEIAHLLYHSCDTANAFCWFWFGKCELHLKIQTNQNKNGTALMGCWFRQSITIDYNFLGGETHFFNTRQKLFLKYEEFQKEIES